MEVKTPCAWNAGGLLVIKSVKAEFSLEDKLQYVSLLLLKYTHKTTL